MNSREIARGAVKGSAYNIIASMVTLVLGLTRAVLLARLLLPAYFGVVALALVFLNLAGQLRAFGLDTALIHKQETGPATQTTYFTLRLGTLLLSLVVIIAAIPLITPCYPQATGLGAVMLALAGVELFKGFNSVQETLLSKEMAFRPLALTNVVASISMTIVAPLLAWQGFGVWALVGERASGMIARGLMVWLPYRRWRPTLGWNRREANWFWRYGRAVWGATTLSFFLDRFDDFWTGTFLGATPLGYYNQAYQFARYPRRVVANPLIAVFLPTFAKLQKDRVALSKAFFRMMSLMVRVGFLLAIVLIWTAPEFIRLFLGEKWLPMRLTFQLMVVYISIDPLMAGMHQLLLAVGRPMSIVKVRVWQLALFVPAVVGLGTLRGIAGVALAADLMVLFGAGLLARALRPCVDFSWRVLLFWPLAGVLASSGTIVLLRPFWQNSVTPVILIAKIVLVVAVYVIILFVAEREQWHAGITMLRHAWQHDADTRPKEPL